MVMIIVNVVFIVLAAISVVWSALSIAKLVKLNKRFNAAIVLIPLYKRSKWPVFGCVFLGGCLVADVVVMLTTQYYWQCASVIVIILSLLALFISMMLSKCAVLDSGVIVPFRFIDWTQLYDYKIENGTVFFCGDEKGFDTMFSVTPKLRFDDANLEKLNFILYKYKSNR